MKRNVITTAAIAGILLLSLAVIPASAVDKIAIRGEVVDCAAGHVPNATGDGTASWNAYNFAAFWYDLDDGLWSEVLYTTEPVSSVCNEVIGEGNLTYNTSEQIIEYKVNKSVGKGVEQGLDVSGTRRLLAVTMPRLAGLVWSM